MATALRLLNSFSVTQPTGQQVRRSYSQQQTAVLPHPPIAPRVRPGTSSPPQISCTPDAEQESQGVSKEGMEADRRIEGSPGESPVETPFLSVTPKSTSAMVRQLQTSGSVHGKNPPSSGVLVEEPPVTTSSPGSIDGGDAKENGNVQQIGSEAGSAPAANFHDQHMIQCMYEMYLAQIALSYQQGMSQTVGSQHPGTMPVQQPSAVFGGGLRSPREDVQEARATNTSGTIGSDGSSWTSIFADGKILERHLVFY